MSHTATYESTFKDVNFLASEIATNPEMSNWHLTTAPEQINKRCFRGNKSECKGILCVPGLRGYGGIEIYENTILYDGDTPKKVIDQVMSTYAKASVKEAMRRAGGRHISDRYVDGHLHEQYAVRTAGGRT